MASGFIQRQKNDLIRDISAFGSLFLYVILCIFFLALENYASFRKLLFGAAIIYIFTAIIRYFFFKNRPNRLSYANAFEKLDAASFPSLHASRTAFMAAVLIKFFNNQIISVLLILMALAIAYSRIYLKKHDLKDVSAGIVLGVAVYFAISFIY